jgi:hypothetical protein
MRLLPTIATLSAVLTPLMAEAAFSLPMPRTADFPVTSNPQVNVPVCYIETTSGTTLDLGSLCGSNSAPVAKNNRDSTTVNPNPGVATPKPNVITRDAVSTPTTTPAGTNPNNPNNPNNLNPGTSPTTNPNNNQSPNSGTGTGTF